jgi:hypothetical protein
MRAGEPGKFLPAPIFSAAFAISQSVAVNLAPWLGDAWDMPEQSGALRARLRGAAPRRTEPETGPMSLYMIVLALITIVSVYHATEARQEIRSLRAAT